MAAYLSHVTVIFYCTAALLCSVRGHDIVGDASNWDKSSKNDYEAGDSGTAQINYKLSIFPEPERSTYTLVRRVEETLNLSCQVLRDGEGPNLKFRLEWHLPVQVNNRINRMNISVPGELTLVIKNLQESDAGPYDCVALNEDHHLRKRIYVRIRPKKGMGPCGETQFQCSTQRCISRRYICDGIDDCQGGADDENPILCGGPPCDGKLLCDDGRCMSSRHCCDKYSDPNCTRGYQNPCCEKFFRSLSHDIPLHTQQHYNDIGFLQSTMYTIVGCAIAFVLIVTITVVAICRVHMKRSHFVAMASACRASRTHPLSRTGPPTWTDLDAYLSATSDFYRHGHGNRAPLADENNSALLVTYNINNGVQFVGRPVDPPPYCEVVNAPRREEPPPPYASRDNLHTLSGPAPSHARYSQPSSAFSTIISLLSGGGNGGGVNRHSQAATIPQEEHERQDLLQGATSATQGDNNNGDINGNSTEQVRVLQNGNGQNYVTSHQRIPSTTLTVEDPRRLSTLYVSFRRPPSPAPQH